MIYSAFKTMIAFGLAASIITGCGTKDETPDITDKAIEASKTLFKAKAQREAGQKAVKALTRAQVEASDLPLIRFTLEQTNTLSTAADIAQNAGVSSYILASGQGFSMKNGVIIGTRGLGNDMLSLETPYDSIRQGLETGETYRIYRFLDGEAQIIIDRFSCTIKRGEQESLTQLERVYSVIRITESCASRTQKHENTYLIDQKSNEIWYSRQWISPIVGYVRIENLKP